MTAQVLSIPAAVQRPRPVTPTKIIYHDPGQPNPLIGVSAQSVGNFNALPPSQRHPNGVGGYHSLSDGINHGGPQGTLVWAAPDMNRVNGASFANDDGLHHCFCDYTETSLQIAAFISLTWIQRYHIPIIRRTAADWNLPGLMLHRDVEEGNHVAGGHTDARLFPWDQFFAMLQPQPVPVPSPHTIQEDDSMFYKPGQPATATRPVTVKVINGALFAFNATANPFKQGRLIPFGKSHVVDLGLVAGETVQGLSDKGTDNKPLTDRLLAGTLLPNGELARHDLLWA